MVLGKPIVCHGQGFRFESASGLEKDLKRRGKKLRVKIPAGVKDGARIKLRNARQTTEGKPGDIIITVKVRERVGQKGN